MDITQSTGNYIFSLQTYKMYTTFIFLCMSCLICSTAVLGVERDEDEGSSTARFRMEGRVFPPDSEPENWQTQTRILVNGGEYKGFLTEEGTFAVSNIPSGSYVVEVANPDFMYEPVRVDINTKGKMRARKVNFIQTAAVVQVPMPLKLHPRGSFTYFQVREQWRITDFLFSPMVLMMFLPLLIIMLLPKLMNAADPETQREMQMSLNMPKYDVPELSEMMTSFFAGGKKPLPKATAKQTKKRQ